MQLAVFLYLNFRHKFVPKKKSAESQAQVTFADFKFENEYFVRSEFFQIFIPDDLKEIQVLK